MGIGIFSIALTFVAEIYASFTLEQEFRKLGTIIDYAQQLRRLEFSESGFIFTLARYEFKRFAEDYKVAVHCSAYDPHIPIADKYSIGTQGHDVCQSAAVSFRINGDREVAS